MIQALRFGDTVRLADNIPQYGGKVGTIVNRSTPPKDFQGKPILTRLFWNISYRYVRLKGSGDIVTVGDEWLVKEKI